MATLCAECKKPITPGSFTLIDGGNYHDNCADEIFALYPHVTGICMTLRTVES